MILIDIRSSGVGDHGTAGLRKFIADHICNGICEALELEPLTVDVLEADNDNLGDRQDRIRAVHPGKGKSRKIEVEDSGSDMDMEHSDESDDN